MNATALGSHQPEQPTLKVAYTDSDVQSYIARVEQSFRLPEGTLSKRYDTGKPYRIYSGLSLSDIRIAIVLHLLDRTFLNTATLGRAIGLSQQAIWLSQRNGKKYIEIGDGKFLYYHEAIKIIPITSN
jgi:hypothetical protein